MMTEIQSCLRSMREPEIESLVAFVGRCCQVRLLLFFRHPAPYLLSFANDCKHTASQASQRRRNIPVDLHIEDLRANE